MSRGPYPTRALEKAQKIAEKRGLVQHYEREPGMIADFSITNPECNAEIRIKRMGHVRCTFKWLEREAYKEIAGLKMFPSSREISREIWIYSPEYFWRFFRICDTGLVELGRDGTVLPLKSPVPKPKQGITGAGTATGPAATADGDPLPLTPSPDSTKVLASGDSSSPIPDRSSDQDERKNP
jgi:hypothetical protein